MKLLSEVLIPVGGAAVVAAVLAVAIFKLLGKNWIKNQFAKGLERYKHQQEIELARLRVEIDSLLSGAIKLQEYEFQTLPQAWEKLNIAYHLLAVLINPFKLYKVLEDFDQERLKEFLDASLLTEAEKTAVCNATAKTGLYIQFDSHRKVLEAEHAIRDFHNYIESQGIFLPPPLKDNFTKISDNLFGLLKESALSDFFNPHDNYATKKRIQERLEQEIKPLRTDIEQEIYQRLQSHGQQAKL